MSRSILFGLLCAIVVALALRCPDLNLRPMHGDEAVHAVKFQGLWEQGTYTYDPDEYHGPTLYYLTWGWAKLTQAPGILQFENARLRMVAVLFGVGLILLLPLVADGLGRGATVCAGLLTAVSPAMVFYSRYYIHEIPLVFFTFLGLASAWRYSQSRKLDWALLTGASVGLMWATKETFVFSIVAAGFAAAAVCFIGRKSGPAKVSLLSHLNWTHLACAIAGLIAVAVLFFSSFFSNWPGVFDAVRTYIPWFKRAGGASEHMHPWYFYLARLAYFKVGNGPVWTEGLILVLALIGLVPIWTRRGVTGANLAFLRFIALYTLALTAIYSVIGYKTPWCMLAFLHGMILLAGVGAVFLWNIMPGRPLKVLMAVALVAGASHLGFQAWRADTTYCADRRNPYVYAHTSADFVNLVARIDALADVSAQGRKMVIKIMAPESDYWPLPWYLRDFSQIGYWNAVPQDPYSPIMVVSSKLQAGLDEKNKNYIMVGLFQLRTANFLELYVQADLWRKYLEQRKAAPAQGEDE